MSAAIRRSAFTLLELLVVIATALVLLSIMLPALSGVRRSAKRLICAANMRTVVSDFAAFAEGTHPQGRGDSEALGSNRFRINDFQDLLYRIDEFWDQGAVRTASLSSEKDAMLCPSGASKLNRRNGYPCGRESLGPIGDVSIALNMRLHRPVMDFRGKTIMAPVAAAFVSSRILDHPLVPLVIDVDGARLADRGVDPFYVAPPAGDENDPYSTGQYWVQSTRHGRSVNVGFVGGHVLASQHPERERWNWGYQAEVNR